MQVITFVQTVYSFNALKTFRKFLLIKVIFFLNSDKSTKSMFLGLGIVEVGYWMIVLASS
jgi:hypothetical protein